MSCSTNRCVNKSRKKRGQRIQEIAGKKNQKPNPGTGRMLPLQNTCCPPAFNTDIKTPYSNLTAEVEWWHGSRRRDTPLPQAPNPHTTAAES